MGKPYRNDPARLEALASGAKTFVVSRPCWPTICGRVNHAPIRDTVSCNCHGCKEDRKAAERHRNAKKAARRAAVKSTPTKHMPKRDHPKLSKTEGKARRLANEAAAQARRQDAPPDTVASRIKQGIANRKRSDYCDKVLFDHAQLRWEELRERFFMHDMTEMDFEEAEAAQ